MEKSDTTQNERCCECRHKHIPRDAQTIKAMKSRLNRITGQLGGIAAMLDDNRYCADILIQVAAAESALQSFGYLVLREHLETCVSEDIRSGSTDAAQEVMELIKKLK